MQFWNILLRSSRGETARSLGAISLCTTLYYTVSPAGRAPPESSHVRPRAFLAAPLTVTVDCPKHICHHTPPAKPSKPEGGRMLTCSVILSTNENWPALPAIKCR